MNNTIMQYVKDAHNKGNKAPIAKTKIDNAMNEHAGTHAIRLQMLAASLFNYAEAHAMTGKDYDARMKKATDDFFTAWNPVATVYGIMPEQSDLTFLFTVGTFKLVKAKDKKDEKGNVTETGKRNVAAVSDSMFQRDIETLAGKKMHGIEWHSGEWHAMNTEKLEKMNARLKKREEARAAASAKNTATAARKDKAEARKEKGKTIKEAKPASTKPTSDKTAASKAANKSRPSTTVKPDTSAKQDASKPTDTAPTPITADVTKPEAPAKENRRLDGTAA